jgi:polysaccharide export outer membrane protein
MNLIKPHNLILSLGCLLIAVSIGAAQTSSTQQTPQKIVEDAAPKLKTPEEFRYQLVSGDVIDVIYRYTPEFNQTVTIQPDGYVLLEIVGDIKVSGLTLERARQKIIEKATVRLKDPEVTLLLKEFQKPYFVVSGEVAQTGKFEMRENITALQAVMMAGGFKESAKVSQIVVFRKLNAEFAEVKTLNLKNVKKTSDLENDLTLQPGDIIFVPRNTFSKIEKFVRLSSLGAILNPIIR